MNKLTIQIKKAENGDKELFVGNVFQASWDGSVDDMETIMPHAAEIIFKLGQESKALEIRNALGMGLRYDKH